MTQKRFLIHRKINNFFLPKKFESENLEDKTKNWVENLLWYNKNLGRKVYRIKKKWVRNFIGLNKNWVDNFIGLQKNCIGLIFFCMNHLVRSK